MNTNPTLMPNNSHHWESSSLHIRIYGSIAFLAILVYSASIFHNFAYDDFGVVAYDNRLDKPLFGLTLWGSQWWKNGASVPISRPLTTFTFWLQTQLHGRDMPACFHSVNIVLFGILTALVSIFTTHILRSLNAGIVAGLLFAVHPIHTEVVANVVGRAEIIALIPLTLGATLWIRWRNAFTLKRYFAIGLCTLLGGLGKENGYLLPAILVVIEIAIRRYEHTPILAKPRHWRFVAIIFMVAAIAIVQREVMKDSTDFKGSDIPADIDNPLTSASTSERWITPFRILGKATQLILVPVGQSPDYSPRVLDPTDQLHEPFVLLGLAAFAIWAGATAFAWHRRYLVLGPLLAIPIAWFIPSNTVILIGTIFGERLVTMVSVFIPICFVGFIWKLKPLQQCLKIPGIAISALAILFACYLWVEWDVIEGRGLVLSKLPLLITPCVAAVVITMILTHFRKHPLPTTIPLASIILMFAWSTALYSRVWTDNESLYTYTIVRHEKSGRIQGYIASMLVRRGMTHPEAKADLFNMAEHHAKLAMNLWPRQTRAYEALGMIAEWRGEKAKARQCFRMARRAEAIHNLGDWGLEKMGELESREAIKARRDKFKALYATQPEDLIVAINLAKAYFHLKEYDEAVSIYDDHIDIGRTDDLGLLEDYLDTTLALGQFDKTLQIYKRLVDLKPDQWPILLDGGIVAMTTSGPGDLELSHKWLSKVLSTNPNVAEAWAAMGQWHIMKKNEAKAIENFREALSRSNPDDPKWAHYKLMLEKAKQK